MPDFYNPYQFISAKGLDNNAAGMLEIEKIKKGKTQANHSYWHKDNYSGKINCTLTIETPTVVGNKHNEDKTTKITTVESYKYVEQLAIPANSLRGMIAQISEAISNSALRVLKDEKYTVRKEVSGGLKATGQIIKKNNKWYILPLSVADFSANTEIYHRDESLYFKPDWIFPEKWKKIFRNNKDELLDWEDILPVYIIAGHQYFNLTTQESDKIGNKFYFLPEPDSKLSIDKDLPYDHDSTIKQKISEAINKRGDHVTKSLLGNKIASTSPLLSVEKNDNTKKFVLRQLETEFDSNLPKTKKHALLLPYDSNRKRVPVLTDIVEVFEKMRKQRYKATEEKNKSNNLPAYPIQIRGYRGVEDNNWNLLNGEIVYFDIDDNGGVTEISTSAIWRSEITQTAHQFFNKEDKDKNILPLQDNNRTHLTPAESLFGVIENTTSKRDEEKFALSGRVIFSDAYWADKQYNEEEICPDEVTLQRMAEPKPPSPALYFHKQNHSYINKSDLNNKAIIPNGRKIFLRQSTQHSYNTGTDKSGCVQCKPIVPDNEKARQFQFSVNYENLSKQELGLLLYSLKPELYDTDKSPFYHLIGLGKPFGMGRISLSIDSLECIERHKNYCEFKLLNKEQRKKQIKDISPYLCKDLIIADSITKILLIGHKVIEKQIEEVSYPVSNRGDKGFDWFVANEKKQQRDKQNMGTITSTTIPKLRTN